MSKDPNRDSEYKIIEAINKILKADSYLTSLFTDSTIQDFNIHSSSLLFRNVVCTTDSNGFERALAVYFPNIVQFTNNYNNWEESNPTIYIECMSKYPHNEFGDEPARKDSFSILKDIKKTLYENKTLKVILRNQETSLDEQFQVSKFTAKNIEPLQMGSFNSNFSTCISLLELEVKTT